MAGETICQVGQDKGGLPIGLQFIGRPWSEATLLHIAFAMQARLDHHNQNVEFFCFFFFF